MSSIHLQAPNRRNGQRQDKSADYEEKRLIYTGKGVINSIYVVNKAGTKRYLFVCDATGAPTIANTLVPPIVLSATDGAASLEDLYGWEFTTGLYIATSTTVNVYTASAANDVNWSVKYAVSGDTPTTDA
jgi:hypothetical protein